MQGHDGPLTRFAGQVQLTAVAFNQGFGKRQPKTGAAVVRRPGIVNLAKWRQRGDDVFRLDADPGVLYLDPQADFATTDADTLTFPPAGVNLDVFDTRLNRT